MDKEVTDTILELTQLASSLSGELEDLLIQKQANEKLVKSLYDQLAVLQKSADTLSQEKVILEKVASHGIAGPELIPVLGKLEKAGFIKAGSAMEAYSSIKRRPDHLVDLLTSIADSFSDGISEGTIEKRASDNTLPEESNERGQMVDLDGWSRIITEGA